MKLLSCILLLYFYSIWTYITAARLKKQSGIPLVHIPSSRIFFYDYRPHDMKAKRTIAENQHCYQVKNPAGQKAYS